MSTPTDVVLRVDTVLAGGQLHGWLIVPQPQYACPTPLCLWRHDRTILILLTSVVWNRRMARTAVARVDKEPRLRARETVPRAGTEQDLVSLARAAIAASDTSVPLAAMDVGLFLGVARRWSLLLQPGGGQLPRCWPESVSRISDLGPGLGM